MLQNIQSTYNDNKFHFSAEILSFITLWSILNEIQECYYKKGAGSSATKVYNPGGTGPNVFIPIDLNDWKIKNQTPESFYIIEKPIFDEKVEPSGARKRLNTRGNYRTEIYGNIKLSPNSPFFEIDAAGYKKAVVNLRQKLFLQIAYLLLAKVAFKSSSKKVEYLKILKASNDERNKLYITHGEGLNSNFHASTEKSKVLPNNRTLNLFKLITFLLTGNDRII